MKVSTIALLFVLIFAGLTRGPAQQASKLELKRGDHVAILGNALPDRMQHTGYFETLIHARFPNHELVFRNLAASGDEVSTWQRSENFGTRDEWLKRVGADVVFAFYGFNESFQGSGGLEKFKADLGKFLKDLAGQDFSGKGAPRVVLFSPIANERHQDVNFPDPAANNANLREYTAALAQVARDQGVPVVDLFGPTQQLYEAAARRGQSLTINGFLLGDTGDKLVADVMFNALFGEAVPAGNHDKLRAAVNERNWQWHQRYRTMDGYNVYGGRSALAYQEGKGGFITDRNPPAPYVSNFKVMQEEMSQRDVLTANRDQRIWAVARGGDLTVDDSNLPPVTPVRSNKPFSKEQEIAPFLSGEEAITKMTVHSGMKVNLFADEKQFPDLVNPVQMAWDTKGRLWVSAWRNYPERTPTSKVGDKLLIFEDTDGDGRADKVTPFLEDLNCPTGFQFYKDGVLVMQAPDFWFARDTDGDGKADWKERLLMGMDSADSHHTANAICLDPGGAMYLSDGVFHRTQVETAAGPVRNNDGGIYRYEPRTGRFATYVSYGFANPHGRVFDRWGNDIITDATGNANYFGPAFSGYLDYPAKHPGMKEFWNRPSRPCPGTGILTSRHFPEEFQGNFLNINVISFQGIYRVKVSDEGSGLKGETLENLISSTDVNFRPICVSTGPDGAIYFCDWANNIIGHMQHHIRDPNRDHEHGRIYRITYEGRPLMKPARIEGQPIPGLLELLKEPENQTRELAKIELGKHDSSQVIAATRKWAAALDKADPDYEHRMMESLWVHQWHNVVDGDLLRRMLGSPDHRARAAAARVLCYWRDRVPDALSLFKTLAVDEHPRVRLEAVRAASFFRTAEAADMALSALKFPTDYYLDYTLKESLRQLDKWWHKAFTEGKPIAADNPAGFAYLLRSVSTAELMKLPTTAPILEALVTRTDLPDADRAGVLLNLSKERKASRVTLVLDMMETPGRSDATIAALARLLPWQLPEELKPARDRVLGLAKSGRSTEIRQAAWAALAATDESFEGVWREAGPSADSLAEMIGGIPYLLDPDFRAQAYDRVKPLLGDTTPNLPSDAAQRAALRRAAVRASVSMNRDQAAVFAALSGLIVKGEEVTVAAQGMRVLPRSTWPKAEAGAAAGGLVAWARTVPASGRTKQDYIETVQFAGDLAGFLPADQAAGLRRELRDLRVSVFVIRSVREQMRYDTPRIVVEAGKPFEIIFENADFMPHNLAVVKPGTRDRIGTAAAAMKPDELDSKGRAYLPWSDDILGATKLLEPGQKETLKLRAPATEGDHEYVCTFPGHHQVMWGWLIVTPDVDAYLQAHPESRPSGAGGTPGHEHHPAK